MQMHLILMETAWLVTVQPADLTLVLGQLYQPTTHCRLYERFKTHRNLSSSVHLTFSLIAVTYGMHVCVLWNRSNANVLWRLSRRWWRRWWQCQSVQRIGLLNNVHIEDILNAPMHCVQYSEKCLETQYYNDYN